MPRLIVAFPLFAFLVFTPACKALNQNQRLAEIEALQYNDREAVSARLGNMENRMGNIEQNLNEIRQSIGLLPSEKRSPEAPVVPYLPASPKADTPGSPPAEPFPAAETYPLAAMPDFGSQLSSFGSGSLEEAPVYAETPASPPPALSADNTMSDSESYSSDLQQNTAQRRPERPAQSQKRATAAFGPKAAYDAALSLYYKGQYAQSQEAFSAFMAEHPSSSLTPNALYWKGECLYSLGKFDQAILAFKDVAGKYPKHDKAAAALLKAGYSYAELKDMGNARFYWQLLVDDFPASAPAGLARQRLAGV